jgi:D-arabinose 1-dehydrogenase-like Zn-dependent alcohol dehydrogenase
MKAARLLKARDIQIQDVPIPELGDDGVLVDVKVATICHTDVIIRSGALTVNIPVTLGHEGAGVDSACLGRGGVIKSRLNYLKKGGD